MKRSTFILLLLVNVAYTHAANLPAGFSEILIAQGLDPTDMVIASDGRIFITVKSGKILIVENDVLLPEPFLNIESQVDNYNERGLGHIVLDPDFEINNYYYVYYTVKNENHNRVSRFTATGNFTVPGSEVVLLDLSVMPGTIHNAGAMLFGLDGKLYISAGDGADANNAQLKTNLLGKILRINPDGTIPGDNPFINDAAFVGKNKAIWALGFRNPFTMSNDPVTGKIYANDVGAESFEEVNEIQAGKNYGWPVIEGFRTNQTPPVNYQDPVYAYPHGDGPGAGCSVIGSAFYSMAVYPPTGFPDTYHGRYFFADYCNGYIRMIDSATGTLVSEVFASEINRPLAIRVAPDGSLYYMARAGIGGGSAEDNTSSNNGTLWKVTYTGSGSPVIAAQPQNVLVPIGDPATFQIAASGIQPLSYQWQINNADVNGATSASYTFDNAQLSDDGKEFRCVVTNSEGTATSNAAILNVTTNTRPVPSITLTLSNNATLYQGGYLLTFTGTAADAEDGDLNNDALEWKIDFHHDSHVHPALGWTGGIGSGIYSIPVVGETAENVWLRVYLKATDSEGLSNTIFEEIFPQKSDLTLETDPPGLKVILDGKEVETPYTFTGVVGLHRTLEAPGSQTSGASLFSFDHWSETGAERSFTFSVPEENKTITAFFNNVPVGDGTGLAGYYYSNQNKTFTNPSSLTRLDPTINFYWGGGPPDTKVSADHFTARWVGEILPPFTDTYTFYVTADDGIRLWVNEQLIIDKWIDQPPTEWTGTAALEAGQKYPLKIEYYENEGEATIRFEWSSSKISRQIIPKTQFSSDLVTGTESNIVSEVKVYPTLASDQINIQSGSSTKNRNWTILNTMGQLVMKGKLSGELTSIDISGLSDGVYILKFIQGPEHQISRFIKQ